jgi:hypothetical protein
MLNTIHRLERKPRRYPRAEKAGGIVKKKGRQDRRGRV